MVKVDLDHVYKKYKGNDKYSVTDFNLHIDDKEFIVFVGPSGCGKSTTLRMIAGLEDITKGTLKIGGKVMNDVAPKNRDIAMVFQNYALYPHMSVFDNMSFGLKLRKYPKDEIKKRVDRAAKILGLTEYLNRKPAALSGGQRQRVALGRAIVRDAPIFLMDEPLSNLDAKLRVSMRAEIAKLHQQLNTTTIYVTHDQTEAMTLADRIVIIKDGVQQQVGSPMEVYNKPANVFVAGFIGSPAMNFFHVILKDGKIIDKDNHDFEIPVPEGKLNILKEKGYEGKELIFGIRPEDVHTEQVFLESFPENVVEATVVVSELLGAETQLYCKVGNTELVSKVDARDFTKPGAKVKMGFEMNKAHFFDPESQITLDN
ncbi:MULTISPECIES: ABC transporter ATP-binding protein [Lactobacillus]|uniref:sn-glycerol-3-phosphate ABC transporter ATP-binding protein UgpC n=1 Tax=Lactobacillus xujianguonis TaxID=2495899 RepID=A0A437SUY1_9LACO|nr:MULTISPECIES: sn-glycerol-3-phosphate ABC transporter ATP-binding protein UgpC [Lactobacillus]RVU70749.1 sn-glycerol-3-phosphate ABC transporter ATP-binding protein UgpC [Lactobacillus xujianguonis]RVU73990.1 sn-glycerol-3-phosphate ABC transporter ATP-binding protein UgpC [Lactobacillus xujianguonis]